METLKSCKEINNSHIGMFVRFEGHGILSGLKDNATKHELWKILKVDYFSERYKRKGLLLKRFQAKATQILPEYYFEQACEIYTKAEQKKLPRAY